MTIEGVNCRQKNGFFHLECDEKVEALPRRARSTSDLTDCRLGCDVARRVEAEKILEDDSCDDCDSVSTDFPEAGTEAGTAPWSHAGSDCASLGCEKSNIDPVEFEMFTSESVNQNATPSMRDSPRASMSRSTYGSPMQQSRVGQPNIMQSPMMLSQSSPMMQSQCSPMMLPSSPMMQPSSPMMQPSSPMMQPQQTSDNQNQTPLGFVYVAITADMMVKKDAMDVAMGQFAQRAQEKLQMNGDVCDQMTPGQQVQQVQQAQQMQQMQQAQQMQALQVQLAIQEQMRELKAKQMQQQVQSKAASQKNADYTIMLRNIPNKYTQDMLLEHLNKYRDTMDFVYLPTDFKKKCNLGYAFINFSDMNSADAFTNEFQGSKLPLFSHSPKTLAVTKARVQGLKSNIKRFRSSSVMGVLSEDAKPMLFQDGVRVPFPSPLRQLPPVGPRYTKDTKDAESK